MKSHFHTDERMGTENRFKKEAKGILLRYYTETRDYQGNLLTEVSPTAVYHPRVISGEALTELKRSE